MRKYHIFGTNVVGPRLARACRLRSATDPGTASVTSAPTLQSSMARVWVLRQPNAPGGNVAAADPMVYANGAPLAQSAQGTVLPRFRARHLPSDGAALRNPANLVATLQLAPGTQSYVQVQAVPNWEMGSTAGGASFAVPTMSRGGPTIPSGHEVPRSAADHWRGHVIGSIEMTVRRLGRFSFTVGIAGALLAGCTPAQSEHSGREVGHSRAAMYPLYCREPWRLRCLPRNLCSACGG